MLLIVLATSIMTARAQSSSTTIQYNDKMEPALVLELPNTTDDAEGTILEKLKQTGYDPETRGHLFWKKNKTDGFYMFNNVRLPSLGTQTLDMYFKVVQKNKEEKNNSTVYLMVSNGNGNFVSPESDSALWNSSQMFLNGFVEKTTAYSLEQDISEMEAKLKKSQNYLASLQKEEKEMTDKINVNREEQKTQEMNIQNQSKSLEDLKLKRKV